MWIYFPALHRQRGTDKYKIYPIRLFLSAGLGNLSLYSVHIVIDTSQYNYSRTHFDEYLSDKFRFNGFHELINYDMIHISHTDSMKCHEIQAADFIAGCLFRKYRDNDDSDYSKYFERKTVVALDFFNGRLK